MKVKLIAILVFILPIILIGQIEISDKTAKKLENSEKYVAEGDDKEFDEEEMANYIEQKKLRFSAEVGTFFGTGFGNGSYFGTYVSPHLSYKVSPKFTLSGGMRLETSFMNTFNEPGYSGYGHPGYYYPGSLNDRLIVSGTVYKQFDLFSNPDPAYGSFDNDIKGIIMGVDYKLGENVFIRGEIEISDGYRPYGYPRSSNPAFGADLFSPFNDPF